MLWAKGGVSKKMVQLTLKNRKKNIRDILILFHDFRTIILETRFFFTHLSYLMLQQLMESGILNEIITNVKTGDIVQTN